MKTTSNTKFNTVEEYIAALPPQLKTVAKDFRKIIKQIVPRAEEVISYNMPAFKLNGILVWYAVYKAHIGFYPRPSAIKVFEDELTAYKTSKGAIQFPIEKAIPAALVKKIVRFRINENLKTAGIKLQKNL